MGTLTQVAQRETAVGETVDLEATKRGSSDTAVLDLILKRWSPRAFAATPVTGLDLHFVRRLR